MITTSDFKKGVHILYDGIPYLIMSFSVVSPSARGADTVVKTKVRNVLNDSVHNLSFKGGDKFEQPNLDLRAVQHLYSDGTRYHFMDQETFDQFELGTEELGDQAGYLTDGLEVRALYFNEKLIGVELPNTVDLKVTECDPSVKGATAKAQTKNAVLETGISVMVPAYLESGETVRVDTRDGSFVRRV